MSGVGTPGIPEQDTLTGRPDGPCPLLARCVCPACHGGLIWSSATVDCAACRAIYRRDDGIPIFTSFDEASVDVAVRYKLDQADFFDAEGAEWEINRPHGAPAFHGWLMTEKFNRSVRGLEGLLAGATVLTVCGGSGMDAEFLARAGAQVIASDISVGAAKRVRERARRHGVAIVPIVADVERLPFSDKSVDVVYVHDGLHHLDDPARGLSEMLRVAVGAISVSEPVQAGITQLAVRVRLAQAVEQAGNRVERVDLADLAEILRAGGFRVLGSERYGMFYRHRPGPAARLLSRRRLLPIAARALGVLNEAAGHLGNKGTIQAVSGALFARAGPTRGAALAGLPEAPVRSSRQTPSG